MIRLSVNIDHVATIRQARRADEPDPVWAAVEAELGGADGITFHLREDRRHINDRDAELLRRTVQSPLNMEMSIAPDIVAIAVKLACPIVTLVPERREELTTEGGLDVAKLGRKLKPIVKKLKDAGCAPSAFIEPTERQIAAAADCGFVTVELWTGGYARARNRKQQLDALQALADGIESGWRHKLTVRGGHGLTYRNIHLVAAVGGFEEFNIGHSIVSRAVLVGMREAVREMKERIHRGASIDDLDDADFE